MKESNYNIWIERGDFAYVFNGISGALLRLSKEEYDALRRYLAGADELHCSPKFLEQMALGRMLVPTDGDELQMLARRYEKSRHDTSEFGLTIVTSLGCNFDCPYCFEAKHPSIIDAEVETAILAVVDDQLPKINKFSVAWFGGEPLVGKKPLLALSDAFIARCAAAGVDYSAQIITNGYLLDEETCAALRERRVLHAQIGLDGPPSVHNAMRPLASGKESFWGIVKNLHHAVNYFSVSVRVNIDKDNFKRAEELFQILQAEGFAGKLDVYPGQLVAVNDGTKAPWATYRGSCFANAEFAQAELQFIELAARYGLASASLPRPFGTPCTAVRANELVVGSKGELYKCWESVGNVHEVIGNIREYGNINGRMQKWLKYDPFANPECTACTALPVCMGGCAHHALEPLQYENRCGTFRHNYRERVLAFVETAEQTGSTNVMPAVQITRRMETR